MKELFKLIITFIVGWVVLYYLRGGLDVLGVWIFAGVTMFLTQLLTYNCLNKRYSEGR